MSRGTQGVKLIDLKKKNDYIASVCKVMHIDEEDETAEDAGEIIDSDYSDANEEMVRTTDLEATETSDESPETQE